ncbi:MAG: multifunctional CCA tRNA nucleotidyl transferase/2'3'-cyclic phosphodiesterase/2'nucleotidase/phosphatase, partial [Betaproteobacteria bacterium]
INAMARDEKDTLIDPFGGERDLRAGVLRHVSPAFAEDPLRVLRVARFAARFGFVVAPETEALMRGLVASGEMAELSPERVWQELARGLMEPHPSRMLAVLRGCGALAAVLPEVDALYGVPQPPAHHPELDTGVHVAMALDYCAHHAYALPVRYAVLVHDLGKAETPAEHWPKHHAHEARSVRLAARVSERLHVPIDCRDAARLAARWHGVVHRALELDPASLLDLITATDAFRRPERLLGLLQACKADACSRPGRGDYPAAEYVRAAFGVAKGVDAGRVARGVKARNNEEEAPGADAIGKAVRAARLRALRDWTRRKT